MNATKITLVGLGTGSPDALTLGAIRTLRSTPSARLFLRTRIHPTVAWLEANEQITFSQSFDHLYESERQFDDVYRTIAKTILAAAKDGDLTFVVPGHPLLGEQSVALILEGAAADGIAVEIAPAVSFIETVLSGAKVETGEIKVVDALSLPDLQNPYRSFSPPFDVAVPNLVYQVYDRDAASNAKIALLDYYPAEHMVTIVRADTNGATSASTTPLAEMDRPAQHFDHLTTVLVPAVPLDQRPRDFHALLNIMAQLREPEHGCPWDIQQTPETIRKFMIEEAYEVLDALDEGDPDKYAEELGDLLLQVVFHAQLAREDAQFTIDDVVRHIVDKLVRRHPHVFGNVAVADADEVLRNWNAIKKNEKGYEDRKSLLDGVGRTLPALSRAMEISKRAAKAGFEWDDIEGVFDKLDEEVKELRDARLEGDSVHIADELGDLLFTVVNLARFDKVDPEDSLQRMVNRFIKRFKRIEDVAEQRGVKLEEMSVQEMESIWQLAKREQLQ